MKKRVSRLAAFVLAAALLTGCGAGNGDATSAAAAQDMMSAGSLEGGGAESALLPEDASTTESAQKLIYNADLTMETTDFDAARDALQAAVDANGAWLEYSEMDGSAEDQDRRLYYTVRVPVGHYSAFLDQAGQSGRVLSLNESAEDVTASYIDVEARIASLEDQRERLNALADQAETTADLLEIESQLSDVQYELESYTRQLRALDGQITYSTVNVTLREVATLTPTGVTFVERLGDAFTGGWSGFVIFLQGLILTLVYLWPLLLLVAAVIFAVRRVTRRHRANHPKPPKPAAPAKPIAPAKPTAPGQNSAAPGPEAPTPPADYGAPSSDTPKPKY